jgi:hypothetical protein
VSRPAWPVGGSCAGLADAVEEFARFVRQYADAVADACPPAAALAPMNPENAHARPRGFGAPSESGITTFSLTLESRTGHASSVFFGEKEASSHCEVDKKKARSQ